MKTRRTVILTTYGITLLCLAGCAKQQYDKQRYWLDIQRPKTGSGKTSAAILTVEPFSIDSAFRTRSIVYKKTTHQFENSFYREYLIPPATMMTQQTRRWLSDSGLFARVLQPGSIMKPTHVLEGHIVKAYADASVNNKAAVQLEISLYLLKKNKGEEEILFGKTYTAREPMGSPKAEDYFKALEIAMTKVLQQYEKELAALLE
ncbi:MAG: ABC-type transport auxiliary lipoprotein family protein [Planctomycetota bacterium]|jgi:cholesterol transport system auxiliary component